MVNFEAFWRNWLGKNEALSKAERVRRETEKELRGEIKKQNAKRKEMAARVRALNSDIGSVDKVLGNLNKELVSIKSVKD